MYKKLTIHDKMVVCLVEGWCFHSHVDVHGFGGQAPGLHSHVDVHWFGDQAPGLHSLVDVHGFGGQAPGLRSESTSFLLVCIFAVNKHR